MTEQEKELQAAVKEISDSKQKVEETPKDDPATKVQEDLNKLKAVNDAYEAERLRAEEIRAKEILGGKAQAGQPEVTPEQEAKEEAEKILRTYVG